MKINFTDDEALVLYEWLASMDGHDSKVRDEAEQTVLWKVEGLLEKEIPGIFGKNYNDEVANAKRRIIGDKK